MSRSHPRSTLESVILVVVFAAITGVVWNLWGVYSGLGALALTVGLAIQGALDLRARRKRFPTDG